MSTTWALKQIYNLLSLDNPSSMPSSKLCVSLLIILVFPVLHLVELERSKKYKANILNTHCEYIRSHAVFSEVRKKKLKWRWSSRFFVFLLELKCARSFTFDPLAFFSAIKQAKIPMVPGVFVFVQISNSKERIDKNRLTVGKQYIF